MSGLLPLAVVVAVSPVPMVAVLLVLLSPNAGRAGPGFLAGWIGGIAGVTTVVLLIADDAGAGSGPSSAAVASVEVALGVLLLALAARQWWSRPASGEPAGLPRWLGVIDRFTAVRAGGLGLLLSAANPKALLVCVAAGLAIAGGTGSAGESAWSVVVFTGLAGSTVALVVLAHAVRRTRVDRSLRSLRGWLTARGQVVTVVLLLAIGAVLVAQGVSGLV